MVDKLADFENYIGDVNLEYGGTFFDLSDWRYGYVDALRVTDLDSAAGIDQTVLVERVTIIVDNHGKVKSALESYGMDFSDVRKLHDARAQKLMIAEACLSYGYYDPCEDMSGPYAWEIYQRFDDDDEKPDRFDNRAEFVEIDDGSLFDWLLEQGMLSDFE